MDNYYVINVTTVLDCIDYEKAEYKAFDDGSVMYFTKYAFRRDIIKKLNIFKTIEFPNADVFVSDEFRDRVLNHGLLGFNFVEVWDSQGGR